MAIFSYKAIDARGLKHKGLLEADSIRQLRQQLRARGFVPLTIEETSRRLPHILGKPQAPRPAFSSSARTAFTRELAIMMDGGLQLEKALKLIAMQATQPRRRERLLTVHKMVAEGASFASGLASCPDDFPALYRATIAAGEHGGNLAGVLNRLAEYGENHLRTLNKIKLALLYPIILCIFSVLVVAGLMVFVFPDITRVFLQSGHALPLLTVVLIALSDGLRHYGLLLIGGGFIGFFSIRRWLARPDVRLQFHKKLLTWPLIGRLVASMNIARFTSTLSMLRHSGIPLAEALKVSGSVLDNLWLQKTIEQVTQHVIQGSSLQQALTQAGGFPPSFISMVAGGEASGELDRVLDLAARNQMRDLEGRVLFGVAILEPLIILALGFMVLLTVLAIMMPILSMNQLVK